MTDKKKISELRAIIEEATEKERWDVVDFLYRQLDPLIKSNVNTIRKHATAVEKAGDPARAATMLRKALRLSRKAPDIQLQLGKIYLDQGRIKEAETELRSVLKLNRKNVTATRYLVQCINHPSILSENFSYPKVSIEESIGLLDQALKYEPEDAALWIQLGTICANEKNYFDRAENAFEIGLKLAPTSPSALHNYGQLKRFRGELVGSRDLLNRAFELDSSIGDYAFSLALCYLFMENLKLSMKWLKVSAKLAPDHNPTQVYMAFVLFLQGKYLEGWKQYESRLKLSEFKGLRYSRPRWDGSKLEGEPILLLREQGAGDNIQFIRYAKFVADKGGKVIVFTSDSLQSLFSSMKGVSVVTSGLPEPKNFHRYCPLMSLPLIFKTSENSIPSKIPYLKADSKIIKKWQKRIKSYSGFRVGLAWRGNPQHSNDRFRSSSLEEMSQILCIDGIAFFSLMKERPKQEEELTDGLIELGKDFEDFSDAAGAIEALDLVITVDTSICHLAGALGRPVWTMLAKGNDWRWGLKKKTTPWYPTMKLYRQKTLGVWDDVYKNIKKDLEKLAAD